MRSRLAIIDPFKDDFVGKNLTFFLTKRRALKKYAYLINEIDDIVITGHHTSMPTSIMRKMPLWCGFIFSLVDYFAFKLLTSRKLKTVTINEVDVAFVFGYKMRPQLLTGCRKKF